MAATQTITVPHLGGITVGYALQSGPLDAAKPTFVMLNGMYMHVLVALQPAV